MSFVTKSPWVLHYAATSCNGCDIEVLACLTPTYEVERFGILNTGNPKHADIGACALSAGVFSHAYNINGGVDQIIPVDVYVPGCAARPEVIIDGVVQALGILDERAKEQKRNRRNKRKKAS